MNSFSSENWKCISFLALVFLFSTSPSQAQDSKAEITGFVAHFWGGTYALSGGQIDVDDVPEYGGIIDFPANRDVTLELTYSYAKTHTKFYSYYPPLPGQDNYDTDVTVNYILIGALHEAKKGKIAPFGGASLGAVVFTPDKPQYSTTWRGALSLQLGLKIDMGDKLGLRIGGRFLFPLYIYGGTVYAGSGGAGYGVSAGIPIVQGDLMAGLTLKL
jgi:hypothetical protein